MNNSRIRRGAALAAALAAFVFIGAAPLAAESNDGTKPWYADGLRSLGFTVFPQPQSLGDIALNKLEGGTAKLADYKGKIVLLNFWATWCPPCRAEMPSMERLWKAHKDKAFVLLGVSEGEKLETVKKFIGWGGYSYPIFVDTSYDVGSEFGVRAYPTTYIINKQGMAIARVVGGIEYDSPKAIELFGALAAK
jgi:thiol-disulfide isomerase/thioredoxin